MHIHGIIQTAAISNIFLILLKSNSTDKNTLQFTAKNIAKKGLLAGFIELHLEYVVVHSSVAPYY